MTATGGQWTLLGWLGRGSLTLIEASGGDRPNGKAGGLGLGFNGVELTALALGGCFSNDLHYVAHSVGVALGSVSISVSVELAGEPLLITSASMTASCETLDGSDPQALIEKAKAVCTVGNSLVKGFPVSIVAS